jgi:hypothetical protein
VAPAPQKQPSVRPELVTFTSKPRPTTTTTAPTTTTAAPTTSPASEPGRRGRRGDGDDKRGDGDDKRDDKRGHKGGGHRAPSKRAHGDRDDD